MSAGGLPRQTAVSRRFKLILIATIVAFIVSFGLYLVAHLLLRAPSDTQAQVIEVFDFVYKFALGAVIGLVVAKIA